jgi:hypothetical protein
MSISNHVSNSHFEMSLSNEVSNGLSEMNFSVMLSLVPFEISLFHSKFQSDAISVVGLDVISDK